MLFTIKSLVGGAPLCMQAEYFRTTRRLQLAGSIINQKVIIIKFNNNYLLLREIP